MVDTIAVCIVYSVVATTLLYYILKILLKYRVNGLCLWLIIGMEIGVVAYIAAIIYFAKAMSILKFQTDFTYLDLQKIISYGKSLDWLAAISECALNTVHWIFAMKYWNVACKLQLLL